METTTISYTVAQRSRNDDSTDKLELDVNLRVLAAERAVVLGVLCHFHLLDDFTKSCTISGAILSANSNLFSVISLRKFDLFVISLTCFSGNFIPLGPQWSH